MKPKISIIIIVKNDRGIADTLAGLATQKRTVPTETIVVDASESTLMTDIRAQYPEVRWFQFVPKIKNKTSIPEQRNFGIQQSEGDIIVFIDASCTPSEGWLVALTQPLLDNSEIITAGLVHALNPKTQINYHPTNVDGDYVTSAGSQNLAFKKELLNKIGGFDESFLFSSDTDFTWRCSDAGYKIRYVREAAIAHDWGSFRDQIKRSSNYGKGRARLFKKHPKRIIELVKGNLYVTIYTLYILGLPLTFFIWWYPLLILLPFIKNIGHKPFKTVVLNLSYTLGFHKQWISFVF